LAVTLRIYDTATRSVRDFVPRVPGKVGIYLCGLTVQSGPHIGHLRGAGVNTDVLRRWLTYRGFDVTLIRNITDIDDKVLAKAVEASEPTTTPSTCCHRPTNRAPPGTSRRCTS
jgi:cysteinyl-tRNA synthetase